MTLDELPPGSLFETASGVRAVKSEYHYQDGGQWQCVLLESGEYAHFPEGNRTRVRAIEVEEIADVVRCKGCVAMGELVRRWRIVWRRRASFWPEEPRREGRCNMGRRGPAPKPRVFRPMNGDRDLRGHRQLEPEGDQPERGAPGMPEWLSAEAKREWRRIVPDLDAVGALCRVDRAALAAYCQAFGELADAIRIVEREGRILDVDVFHAKTGR